MHILKVFKLGNPIKFIAEINLPGIGVINSLRGEKKEKKYFLITHHLLIQVQFIG